MVYYNNLLSFFLLLPFCIISGDYLKFFNKELITTEFWFMNILAGFLGFYLNFSSLWCISTTSATTYAIVGSLNKIPITLIGFVFFNAHMTSEGIWFVCIATLGGFLYAYSKLQNKN